MKKADLEKLGLTAEVIKEAKLPENLHEELLKLNGLDIEAQKAKTTTAEEKVKALEGQLGEANKTIEEFDGMKPADVKKTIDEYKTKLKTAQDAAKTAADDADKRVAAIEFDNKLESALRDAKAKNPKAVKALLKVTDLKLTEDGTIAGLSEQLEKVKADNDYLFSEDEDDETPTIVKGGKQTKVTEDAIVSAMRSGAGLTETKEK